MTSNLHERLSRRLEGGRVGEGFGPTLGAAPEPEPTALAAIALDDDAAREWLLGNQHADGGFGLVAGPSYSDAPTSLAVIALPAGEAKERALDHLISSRAEAAGPSEVVPHDPNTRGWGWTAGTFGWVEPTARAVLALRLHRPGATKEIADGLALIADRECVNGGWNFGNPVVYGVPLEPYTQATAIALIGVLGALEEQSSRGFDVLRTLWPSEPGGLNLATSLAAFRLAGLRDAGEIEDALGREFEEAGFLGDAVALAWATIATGGSLESLRTQP